MLVEASIHELIVQNIDETEGENQLKQEADLIAMDEPTNVQVSMLATTLPLYTLVPNPTPMARSSVMVGYKESQL